MAKNTGALLPTRSQPQWEHCFCLLWASLRVADDDGICELLREFSFLLLKLSPALKILGDERT